MSDIFISYSRADQNKARAFADAFAQEGWTVWWDQEIPLGRSFDSVIETELDSANCVVVLWSQSSITSEWVKAEAEEGLKRNVLVPVLIDNVRIPLGFRRIQTADLCDWQGNASHPHFDSAIRAIAGILNSSKTAQNQTVELTNPIPIPISNLYPEVIERNNDSEPANTSSKTSTLDSDNDLDTKQESRLAQLDRDGWIKCPHCGRSFSTTKGAWDGEKHTTCNGPIVLYSRQNPAPKEILVKMGAKMAEVGSDGWIICPHCGRRFSTRIGSWDGVRHETCNGLVVLVQPYSLEWG